MIFELLDSYEKELEESLLEKKKVLEEIEVKIHETEKMMKLIQEENQGLFTDFTPRPIAEKNADKMEELTKTLGEFLEKKTLCEDDIIFIEGRCKELRISKKELASMNESAGDSSNVSRETSYSVSNLKDKLHLVLSYLPQDPIRAKIELESLLR